MKLSMHIGHEIQRIGRQDLLGSLDRRPDDVDRILGGKRGIRHAGQSLPAGYGHVLY
jgi:hypothetical protein